MTLEKIKITGINRKALGKLLTEIKEYQFTQKYKIEEKKLTFLNQTKLSPYFIVIIASSIRVAKLLHCSSRIIDKIQIGNLQFL